MSLSLKSNEKFPAELVGSEKIISLNLDYFDKLPKEIYTLSNIKYLDISSNYLVELPPEILQFQHLEHLHIDNNKIKEIPSWIGQLKSLQYLNLNYNPITSLPKELGELSKIRQLSIRFKGLTEIPDIFKNLTNLKEFYVGGGEVPLKIPLSICSLTGLKVLSISQVVKEFPAQLRQLTNLERLFFRYHPSTTRYPKVLIALPLKELPGSGFWSSLGGEWLRDYDKLGPSLLAAKATEESRLDIFNIYNLKKKETANIPITRLLEALRVNNAYLTKNIHQLIFPKHQEALAKKPLSKGSEVVVLGSVKLKKSELKDRLAAVGLTYARKINENTSHVVLGKKIPKTTNWDREGLVYISDQVLNDYLVENEEQFITEEKDPETIENLSRLLLSFEPKTVKMGVELVKSGGLPEELYTELFLVAKNTKFPSGLRKTARSLLELKCSELKSSLSSGAIKDNLPYLSKILDHYKIACYYFKKENFTPEDSFKDFTRAQRLELLDHMYDAGSTPPLLAKYFPDDEYKWVDLFKNTKAVYLDISNQKLEEFPEGLKAFKKLETLLINGNNITEVPDWISELPKLDWMAINSNPIEKLPTILSTMPNFNVVHVRGCPFYKGPDKPVLEGFKLELKHGYYSRD